MFRKIVFLHWESVIFLEKNSFLYKLERKVLSFLSFFYKILTRLRNKGYESGLFQIKKSSVPVISIGNISVGGTGKTTLVEWCAKGIVKQNKKVVVLSRGYMRKSSRKDTIVVSDGFTILETPQNSGDEPQLLAQKLKGVPILAGRDRARSIEIAKEKFQPDCVLLDDGFQHRKLDRDLDIVCLDKTILRAPFIFPMGVMREEFCSLKRANFAIIKTENGMEDLKNQFEKTFSFPLEIPTGLFTYEVSGLKEFSNGKWLSADYLKQKRVYSFCGIAHPHSFENLVEKSGGKIVASNRFPDHHCYTNKELKELEQESKQYDAILLTTEKDGVKLPENFPAYILNIEIKWLKGKEELENSILRLLH